MVFGKIAVNTEFVGKTQIYDYIIPDDLACNIKVGVRVLVPFGAVNNIALGYVIEILSNTNLPIKRLKPISKILDKEPPFSEDMIKIAFWMNERYLMPIAKALGAMLPNGLRGRALSVIYIACEYENSMVSPLGIDMLKFIEECGGECDRLIITEYFGIESKKEISELKAKKILKEKKVSSINEYEKKVSFVKPSTDLFKINQFLEASKNNKRLTQRADILEFILLKGEYEVLKLKNEFSISDSPIKTLEKDGLISIFKKQIMRDAFNPITADKKENVILNREQETALRVILDGIEGEDKTPILLHGITGSGKTEVYIKAIQRVLDLGGQAIMLVPEISITTQMIKRFHDIFSDKVSVTHSRLSAGERIDQWRKAKNGEISIIVGPRSAVFTPFKNLRLIIADEEQESSYRSTITPRYDTIEVAKEILGNKNGLLVMCYDNHYIETYKIDLDGKIKMAKILQRPGNAILPKTTVVDMREELILGNRSIFSKCLNDGIKNCLDQKKQAILFINRRGYSSFVSCRKCGYVAKCANCNVSYTYHRSTDSLVCHYCGRREVSPRICPECGSKYIKYFGVGTQKIEEEVGKLFPKARILRMDRDTTARKHGHEEIIDAFSSYKADILIGTQMVAKGLDFSGVSLVGVLAADMSLNTGNFTSVEDTFKLITQVSGRAGRSGEQGEVIIQTYSPESYAIRYAARHDYDGFYNEEIKSRRLMSYPPFSSLYSLDIKGAYEVKTREFCLKLRDSLKENIKANIKVLGPVPAFISKAMGKYQFTIMVKGDNYKNISSLIKNVVSSIKKPNDIGIYVTSLSRELVN